MDWTEIKIEIDVKDVDTASDIAQMAVPYGIYVEDYSDLEEAALEIAHIDLIDEDLLKKDRSKAYIHIYISPEDNPAEAIAFLSERYNAVGIKHTIDKSICRNQDWENNWKEFFKPMPVGDKLLIRPVWEENYNADGRKVLNIEPGLAFGSGGHDTTRLCLEALEKHITPETDMLDVGCGSGILSVAGLLLGANKAVGVDIDPLAVKTARENGKLNGFDEPKYTVFEGNLTDKVSGKYDVVAANIVADIIIMFAKDVGSYLKDGGTFITSGIIDIREQDVKDAFDKYGFKIVARHESKGWICFETVKESDFDK
ncbi:MAG: 50S ribosomal protein L11 methyltransferase [Clostridia bacterium]|nr:50S ribosomal protein L11 methyltransferase [Clostridia bacterium]